MAGAGGGVVALGEDLVSLGAVGAFVVDLLDFRALTSGVLADLADLATLVDLESMPPTTLGVFLIW